MTAAWHKKAATMRRKGKTLAVIAEACGVSPQAVSIALDPAKQKARRKYVREWKRERYQQKIFRTHQQKLDRDSKRRQRASQSD